MSTTFNIVVEQVIQVTLDETKFDDAFMEEFRAGFYPFEDIKEHAEHIAQLQARGIIDLELMPDFVEGYGPSQDMGITAKTVSLDFINTKEVERASPA